MNMKWFRIGWWERISQRFEDQLLYEKEKRTWKQLRLIYSSKFREQLIQKTERTKYLLLLVLVRANLGMYLGKDNFMIGDESDWLVNCDTTSTSGPRRKSKRAPIGGKGALPLVLHVVHSRRTLLPSSNHTTSWQLPGPLAPLCHHSHRPIPYSSPT